MNKEKLVKDIESSFAVDQISYKGLALWLEIRNRFYSKLFLGQESTLSIESGTYKMVLKTMFYGFKNWFRRYNVWFIGNMVNRLMIDETYYDRLFDYPASKFKKALFIELPINQPYPRKKLASKYVVSKSLLIVLEKIIALTVNPNRADLSVFDAIKAKYPVDFSPHYVIKKMVSQYRLMRFILRFTKPEYVFIAPSYTAYGYIKAFKERGIKVIEAQHGVILNGHHGYTVYGQFDRDYFPDYLLTFGGKERTVFQNNTKGIKPESVVPVGSFYLDYISQNFKPNTDLVQQISGYTKVFTASLQDVPVGEALIPILIDVAKMKTEWCFILKPRHTTEAEYRSRYQFPDNIRFESKLNVYETILHADYHVTVYSTCAIEAPVLGKQNVMVDIDSKATEIFGDQLNNETTTVYVSDAKSFIETLGNMGHIDSEQVKQAHQAVMYADYQSRMDDFLNRVLCIQN